MSKPVAKEIEELLRPSSSVMTLNNKLAEIEDRIKVVSQWLEEVKRFQSEFKREYAKDFTMRVINLEKEFAKTQQGQQLLLKQMEKLEKILADREKETQGVARTLGETRKTLQEHESVHFQEIANRLQKLESKWKELDKMGQSMTAVAAPLKDFEQTMKEVVRTEPQLRQKLKDVQKKSKDLPHEVAPKIDELRDTVAGVVGQEVTIEGRVIKIFTNPIERRGNQFYGFYLEEGGFNILVLRPITVAWKIGQRVRVNGKYTTDFGPEVYEENSYLV